MDIKTLCLIKEKFVAREVANELVVVPLSGNVAQMNELFTLNETARFIWENIEQNDSIESVVTKMTDCFDIDTETATNDLLAFLKKVEILNK